MPDTIRLESPLARFDLARRGAPAPGEAGVVAAERAFLGHLNLRGDLCDARFAAAVARVLGATPPAVANTVNESAGATVYWLGPDEWLAVVPGERVAAIEADLRAALTGMRFAVTDVSSGQTLVVLRGPAVRDALAKGCPLDLHPKVFRTGMCAQTHLAKAALLIRPIDDAAAYEIVFRRSFADYLWTWLEDAAAEYGLAIAQ